VADQLALLLPDFALLNPGYASLVA